MIYLNRVVGLYISKLKIYGLLVKKRIVPDKCKYKVATSD